MGLLILYLAVALFFSFFCSLLEASLLSTSPIYLNIKVREGKRYASQLQQYKRNIDLPLSAILTLNTFAHTIGAAGVGSQAQNLWGEEYLTVVSVILTLVILIGSEIIPKTLGALYWRNLGRFTVVSLKIMIYSPLYPFIIFTQFITQKLKRNQPEGTVNRHEFQAITDTVIKEGVFSEEESQILENLMQFNQINTRDIMTPRTVILAGEESITIGDFYKANKDKPFSRIPVYKDELSHVTGFVLREEIMEAIIAKKGKTLLKEIRREIPVIVESMPIIQLFYKLIGLKVHIAIVVDEYGLVSGLVTMEDIIETLIGIEIMDEIDSVEDMQALARQNWEKRARRMGFIK